MVQQARGTIGLHEAPSSRRGRRSRLGGQVARAAAAGGKQGAQRLADAQPLLIRQPPAGREQPLPRRLRGAANGSTRSASRHGRRRGAPHPRLGQEQHLATASCSNLRPTRVHAPAHAPAPLGPGWRRAPPPSCSCCRRPAGWAGWARSPSARPAAGSARARVRGDVGCRGLQGTGIRFAAAALHVRAGTASQATPEPSHRAALTMMNLNW